MSIYEVDLSGRGQVAVVSLVSGISALRDAGVWTFRMFSQWEVRPEARFTAGPPARLGEVTAKTGCGFPVHQLVQELDTRGLYPACPYFRHPLEDLVVTRSHLICGRASESDRR